MTSPASYNRFLVDEPPRITVNNPCVVPAHTHQYASAAALNLSGEWTRIRDIVWYAGGSVRAEWEVGGRRVERVDPCEHHNEKYDDVPLLL